MIQYLKNKQIDFCKWDDTVNNSDFSTPYANSWYLNRVCPGWEALILNDYEAVMPLTCRKKFLIPYLFQPYFAQQLGVFSHESASIKMVDSFLQAIPKNYRYIEININTNNSTNLSNFQKIKRTNYTLLLDKCYDEHYKLFSRNCRRNIIKTIKNGKQVLTNNKGPYFFTDFIRHNLKSKLQRANKEFYYLLEAAVSISIEKEQGIIYTVEDIYGNTLAAAWFLQGNKRIVFQVCASTEEGRKNNAMYLLVNSVIEKYAGSGLILDFAGSNIPGVAFFNSGFGAAVSFYYQIKYNNLPYFLKPVKA